MPPKYLPTKSHWLLVDLMKYMACNDERESVWDRWGNWPLSSTLLLTCLLPVLLSDVLCVTVYLCNTSHSWSLAHPSTFTCEVHPACIRFFSSIQLEPRFGVGSWKVHNTPELVLSQAQLFFGELDLIPDRWSAKEVATSCIHTCLAHLQSAS